MRMEPMPLMVGLVPWPHASMLWYVEELSNQERPLHVRCALSLGRICINIC